ncbi:hypothetical protein P4K67_25985 [Bacillus cereus]|nr:hypothetical protein [Bacillus cereus]
MESGEGMSRFDFLLIGILFGTSFGIFLSIFIDRFVDKQFEKERKQMDFKIKFLDGDKG